MKNEQGSDGGPEQVPSAYANTRQKYSKPTKMSVPTTSVFSSLAAPVESTRKPIVEGPRNCRFNEYWTT